MVLSGQKITSGMLRPLREEVGLGIPPSPFSTNASESINAMLKRKINYKKIKKLEQKSEKILTQHIQTLVACTSAHSNREHFLFFFMF